MIDKVDQIIFLLQSPIIEKYINLLCQFCNIYEFQAIQCMRLYQNLDKIDTKNAQQEKWEIIFNLLNGKYLNEDKIIDNLQLEIIWLLQSKLTNDNIREFAHIWTRNV